MAQGDPRKWNLPGWRIEQRYSTNVLIGNWEEERLKFLKGDHLSNSTNRMDFKNFGNHRPDVIIRRKGQLKSDGGIGRENLFNHHGNRYSNNMISWYDEHYNKRERDEANKLPELRDWDGQSLSWQPEKTDYPIQGAPTNFGLLSSKQNQWKSQIADETRGDFYTTYGTSYVPVPSSAMPYLRYATPREVSTPLLKTNGINKNLHFRGSKQFLSPEMIGQNRGQTAPLHPAQISQGMAY